MQLARQLVVCALALTSVSCAESAPIESTGSSRQGIIDGESSGADQDGVVLLRVIADDGTELVCTGSLVGPNLVLTARHCVAYLSEGQFSCTVRGELTNNPEGAGRLGLHLPAQNIEIFGREMPRKKALARGSQVLSTLSPNICKNDIAFVVLDAAVDLPIVPMRLGRPAQLHETSVLVGYGLDASQAGIDYATQPRLQRRDLDIAALGPDSLEDGVTTVPPRALILKGPSGCIGDSGGPLLAQATGAVLGVYSLQEGESCSAPNLRHQMVHVPPFVTLIDEAFSAAGCVPTPEPEPEGTSGAAGANVGAAGATDAEPVSGSGGAAGATGEGGDTSTAAPSKPTSSSSCSITSLAPPSLLAFRAVATLAGALALRRARRRRAAA